MSRSLSSGMGGWELGRIRVYARMGGFLASDVSVRLNRSVEGEGAQNWSPWMAPT